MGSAGGSAGGSADNVYFHPDTSKFDVVNVYIHAGGGDQGHHTRMGGGFLTVVQRGGYPHLMIVGMNATVERASN